MWIDRKMCVHLDLLNSHGISGVTKNALIIKCGFQSRIEKLLTNSERVDLFLNVELKNVYKFYLIFVNLQLFQLVFLG